MEKGIKWAVLGLLGMAQILFVVMSVQIAHLKDDVRVLEQLVIIDLVHVRERAAAVEDHTAELFRRLEGSCCKKE